MLFIYYTYPKILMRHKPLMMGTCRSLHAFCKNKQKKREMLIAFKIPNYNDVCFMLKNKLFFFRKVIQIIIFLP